MNRTEPLTPKPIVAKDQVSLGVVRCLQLALSGMTYRLFRSLVTTAILALAAAFLVHMLGFGLIEEKTLSRAYEQTQESRRLGQQLQRFTKVDPDRAIENTLKSHDSVFYPENSHFSKQSPAQIEAMAQTAIRLASAATYFDQLPTAPKAVIVGDRSSEELFEHFAKPEAFEALSRHLKQFSLTPPLGDLAAFRVLVLEQRPALLTFIEKTRQGHAYAIETLSQTSQRLLGKEFLNALLTEPAARLLEPLKSAGFMADESRLVKLREIAERAVDQKSLEQWLAHPTVSGAIARRTSIDVKSINIEKVAGRFTSEKDVAWLSQQAGQAGANPRLTKARIKTLLERYEDDRELNALLGEKPRETEPTVFGLSPRNQWLVILSALVCMVGVANAMLMSVTERFTEIATMKCLGAMDRFVMQMFVFEALIQGAVGGLLGLLLGLILALIRGWVEFGSWVMLATGAAGSIGIAMLLAQLCTMALAALSAVGPSYLAAKLSPMEAMRVE